MSSSFALPFDLWEEADDVGGDDGGGVTSGGSLDRAKASASSSILNGFGSETTCGTPLMDMQEGGSLSPSAQHEQRRDALGLKDVPTADRFSLSRSFVLMSASHAAHMFAGSTASRQEPASVPVLPDTLLREMSISPYDPSFAVAMSLLSSSAGDPSATGTAVAAAALNARARDASEPDPRLKLISLADPQSLLPRMPQGVPFVSCDALRRQINLLLDSRSMSQKDFLQAIGGVSRASLVKFLQSSGPTSGATSAVYLPAVDFFRERAREEREKEGEREREADLVRDTQRKEKHGHVAIREEQSGVSEGETQGGLRQNTRLGDDRDLLREDSAEPALRRDGLSRKRSRSDRGAAVDSDSEATRSEEEDQDQDEDERTTDSEAADALLKISQSDERERKSESENAISIAFRAVQRQQTTPHAPLEELFAAIKATPLHRLSSPKRKHIAAALGVSLTTTSQGSAEDGQGNHSHTAAAQPGDACATRKRPGRPKKSDAVSLSETTTSAVAVALPSDWVPVYDNCDDVRRKIARFLKDFECPMDRLARELGANESDLTAFISQKGSQSGATSFVYPQAYYFFEKMRLYQHGRKSRQRMRNEERVPLGFLFRNAGAKLPGEKTSGKTTGAS